MRKISQHFFAVMQKITEDVKKIFGFKKNMIQYNGNIN